MPLSMRVPLIRTDIVILVLLEGLDVVSVFLQEQCLLGGVVRQLDVLDRSSSLPGERERANS